MMKIMSVPVLTTGVFLALTGISPADTAVIPTEVADLYASLRSDQQQAILNERQKAIRQCGMHSIFAAEHECGCIGDRVLVLRMTTEKEQSLNNILESLKYQCPNPSGMVAHYVRLCKDRLYNGDPVAVAAQCTCVGAKVAEEKVYMMQNGGKLFRNKFNYEQECATGKTAPRPVDWPAVLSGAVSK